MMRAWYKHPAIWLTLLFSVTVVLFVSTSQRWTSTRLANAWRREISEADDERAVALLPRLAGLNEVAVPHLVQLLDDDREPVRHAARNVLRDHFNTWLRERTAVDQRCLATLAHEFASQPLPRAVREREFVKQASLKLLRWPGEAATINTTQLLLDCTATLQHIAESRPLPNEYATSLAVAKTDLEARSPASMSLNDFMDDTPLADAEPPVEPAPLTSREPLPQRHPQDDEPPTLPTEGNERLIPPERFVPETPRRMRDSEMNLNDDESAANVSPTGNTDTIAVQTHALRELDTRAVIRHLHGLPAITHAAETELRKRGFNDYTLKFAIQLDDEDPQVRLKLVEALPYVEQINGTAWLFELTNDPDAKVRTAARNILATSRNPQTQRRLGNATRR